MNTIMVITERFVAILLIVLGLSHVFHGRLWASFFTDLRKRPDASLIVGTFTLPFGLLIVSTHNIWAANLSVLTTIIGWGWTLKGTHYLLNARAIHQFAPSELTARQFVIGGAIITVVGAVIGLRAFGFI